MEQRNNTFEFNKVFYKTIFRSITNFIDSESFIAKLLNIYIYMLFIKYLISLKQNGWGNLFQIPSLLAMVVNNQISNQNLENMRIKSKTITAIFKKTILFLKIAVIKNINLNEVEQPILSQLRPTTLSNQRRRFAEGAQSRIKLSNNNF